MASQIRLTVERDTVASGPRASAKVASTSRTDRPRTNPAITNDSRALVLVTPAPSSREAKASSVPRSLGRSRVVGPAVVFTVSGAKPLRDPAPSLTGQSAALVAVAAEELGDLGLQGRLQQQPGAQAGHFLQGLTEVSLGGEQVVDVGADALGGRYSCRHGCRPPSAEVSALRRSLRP